MKNYKKNRNKIVSLLLVTAVFLLMTVISVSFGAAVNESQVKVPLVIDLSHAIAGAQFIFEYSAGLEFVSYEKSAAVSSALTTPVVVKNGYTHVGFYNVDNRYVPTNGKLDIGYLVFNCLTTASQQVTLTEIKLVQVVDNDETRSEILPPVKITVSPENTAEIPSVDDNTSDSSTNNKGSSTNNGKSTSSTDDKNSPADNGTGVSLISDKDKSVDNPKGSPWSIDYWIVMVLLLIVTCGVGVFIVIKKRSNIKK
jgi:hypothetical protein